MSCEISVLIPVYNEQENLVPLVAEIQNVLNSLGKTYELIFIDDGSTDQSREILTGLSENHPSIRVIFFRRNSGQTAAFDAGFRNASGDTIITMDSDLQNDPKDIPEMLRMIEQGYDFVAGWRRKRKDGYFLRTFPSKVANFIIRKVTGTKLHDLGCSLKVYRKELTDELRLYGEMHRFIGVLMEGLGSKVGEIEVNHRARTAGVSKYGLARTFKVIIDLLTVWFLQRYHTKPSYVFGSTGVLTIGASVLVSAFVLWQKFAHGVWVHKNPLFIVGIFLGILGVQFLAMGIISELIIRTYYESSEQRPYSVSKKLGFSDRPKLGPGRSITA